ncbi:MAG: hypothetical protein WCX71_01895 [Candidatus Buchananbacteria bacterium]
MNKSKVFLVLSLFIFGFLFLSATPALALECSPFLKSIGIEGGCLIPQSCTGDQTGSDVNNCGLNAMYQTVINFTQIILALTGSAALLIFVYGGVLWIAAAGKSEIIDKGKQAIIAAAVGLVIVLGSWLVVNTTISALTQGQIGSTPATIFGQVWSKQQAVESPGSGASTTEVPTASEGEDNTTTGDGEDAN